MFEYYEKPLGNVNQIVVRRCIFTQNCGLTNNMNIPDIAFLPFTLNHFAWGIMITRIIHERTQQTWKQNECGLIHIYTI